MDLFKLASTGNIHGLIKHFFIRTSKFDRASFLVLLLLLSLNLLIDSSNFCELIELWSWRTKFHTISVFDDTNLELLSMKDCYHIFYTYNFAGYQRILSIMSEWINNLEAYCRHKKKKPCPCIITKWNNAEWSTHPKWNKNQH